MKAKRKVEPNKEAIAALVPADIAPSVTYLMNRAMFQSFNKGDLLKLFTKTQYLKVKGTQEERLQGKCRKKGRSIDQSTLSSHLVSG